jgi:CHAT domain-containing protein
MKHGEIKAALADTKRALECFPSENSEWHWRFAILKGELLWRQGQAGQAIELLRSEPPAVLAATDVTLRRHLALATANAFTQHLGEADRHLDQAEILAKTHPDLSGEIAIRRGTVRFYDGDMAGAEAAYQKSLRISRELKDPFLEAAALESLGIVATRKEHFDEAVDLYRAALQLSNTLGAQRLSADTAGNMAWCYLELGDFENALAFYNQAEEASTRLGLIGDQIYWLTGIESVHYERHEYAAAQNVLEQALEMARRQDDKSTLTTYLNGLSEIVLETGHVDAAEKYQKEVSEIERVNPGAGDALELVLIRGRIEEIRGNSAAAEANYQRLIGDPSANSPQKWQALAHLAQVYASESQNAKAEKEFRRSLDTIETARSSVQEEELRLSFLSSAISFYGDYIEYLLTRGRSEEALQVAELSRARTLAEGLTSETKISSPSTAPHVPAKKIAARLNSVVLFYWIGEKRSYLWTVTPSKVTYYRLPARAEIDPVVKEYRQAILEGTDVLSSGGESGKQLYTMLVEPARTVIGHNKRVIVVPGEGLYGLNFETLIVPEPTPHFWIEDVTISTANSLALVSAAAVRGDKQKSLLLVGTPESPNPDFPPLAQGPVEVQKVSSHFAEAKREILLGRQATPAEYVSAAPERFAYVHFVAHGTASLARPLDSAVILSGKEDSYKLYAREIVAHPLRARLVTISACNGAGTRAYVGEGLVGLAWAFLRAGARNVVASLWEVSDAPSTTQLMDALYDGLDRGEDPATALRNAKLRVLKSNSNTVFRKPFYWAPFQLYSAS